MAVGLLLFYFVYWFVLNYMAAYEGMLEYLSLLFVLCVLHARFLLLHATYFKVLRLEKSLLSINVQTLMISVLLMAIANFIFQSVYAVVFAMTFAIYLRCLISEFRLRKRFELPKVNSVVVEFLILSMFIVFTARGNMYISFFMSLFTSLAVIYKYRVSFMGVLKNGVQ
jgi:hypothetical protein